MKKKDKQMYTKKNFVPTSTKFSVSATLIIFVTVGILLATTSIFFARNCLNNFYTSAGTALREFSDSITMFFAQRELELNVYADSNEVKNADNTIHSFIDDTGTVFIANYKKSPTEQKIFDLGRSFAINDNELCEMYIGTKWGGMSLCIDDRINGGYDPRKRGWYTATTSDSNKGKKIIITEAYTSQNANGASIVTLARRSYNNSGEFIGVSAIDISLKTLSMILGKVDFGDGSFLMMIQNDGTILADSSKAQNYFKNISEINMQGLDEAIKSEECNSSVIFDGETFFMKLLTNERTGYKIAAFCPKTTVFRDFYKTLTITSLISVALALLAAFFTAVITKKIMGQLNNIVKFVRNFASTLEQGNADYSQRIKEIQNNEIGQLATSINLFISRLSVFMQQMTSSHEKERKLGTHLFEEAQNLVVSTKETAATSQNSAAAVKEIVATMEDSNALSENISVKIRDVSSVANQTSADVAQGVAKIEQNVKQLHEIFDANQQTIEGIKTLSGKIENIWDIVNLINNVADQAKIIAFNAELEASAAGESGKSFRIVANEIRRLSDGIIDGTREIKEQINEIQHSSDTLILASESGTTKIDEGYKNARELEEKFASIKLSSEITARSADDISDIIQQQATASEQILIALREISNGVENFSVATDNISSSAESVRKISEELNTASQTE